MRPYFQAYMKSRALSPLSGCVSRALPKTAASGRDFSRKISSCAIGSALEFDPHTILMAGGAESIDKEFRIHKMVEGYPKIWWEQEGFSEAEIVILADVFRAGIVISHTCTTSFPIKEFLDTLPGQFVHGSSQDMLEKILLKHHPGRWFFGHFLFLKHVSLCVCLSHFI